MRKWIADLFAVLFSPSCWLQLEPYSAEWEARFTRLMAEHRFTDIDQYTAKIGDVCVWIANYPNSTFHPYCRLFEGDPVLPKVRPRRATVIRAHRKLLADAFRDQRSDEIRQLERMMGD